MSTSVLIGGCNRKQKKKNPEPLCAYEEFIDQLQTTKLLPTKGKGLWTDTDNFLF